MPALSLRARSTAVVLLILFAAGILITYFNSVTAQKMEFHDSENDATLVGAELDLTARSFQTVEISPLASQATLALRLNHDIEFIGFFKRVDQDSVSFVASVGKGLSDSEITFTETRLLANGTRAETSPLVVSHNSLYYYAKLHDAGGGTWGTAFIKLSLEAARQIVLRNWLTGFGITVAISILSSVLLLFAIRLTFLSPFEELARGMREAAAGNMGVRLSISSGTEFRTLSSIFNRMMDEVQRAHEIIKSEVKQREDYNRRLQNEITMAIDALHEKSNEIISLQEKLRTFESQAALGKVSSKLAHELGSPLNAIYSSVQLLLENALPLEHKRKLSVIERQVESMIAIINSLLQTRKIAMPAKRDVMLKELVEDTRLVMESKIEESSIELEIQIENPDAIVSADQIQIQQVLINLLNNSIDSIKSVERPESPGHITLKIYEDSKFHSSESGFSNVRIDVTDNGEGVPNELVPQLFNDFINSKKSNGNGIGLIVCKEIIDRHGGRIFLSNNSGKGSTFSVILPLVGATQFS